MHAAGRNGWPPVHGGLYQTKLFSSDPVDFWFVSLNERMQNSIDPKRTVFLYLCRPESFQLHFHGAVTRRTGGLIRSSSHWTSDKSIIPEREVEISLMDLQCPVALHTDGTTHLRALLNYRMAKKAPWSPI